MYKPILRKAFSEVYKKPPKTLKRNASRPMQRKQMIAIALSKARNAGASIPKK